MPERSSPNFVLVRCTTHDTATQIASEEVAVVLPFHERCTGVWVCPTEAMSTWRQVR